MTEVETRLPCPVCLGTTMEKLAFGPGGRLKIDHCRRCGGSWLEHGEIQQLRSVRAAEVRKKVAPDELIFQMRCHDCHAPMGRDDEKCPACGWKNALDCPACLRPMRTESHAGLRLDLCRECKGLWFDHHELEAVWGDAFDRALQQRKVSRGEAMANLGEGASEVMLNTMFFAPELVFYGAFAAGHAAAASIEMASRVPDAIGAAPEAAAGLFDAVGDAAEGVFSVILEIIGGIFDGM